MKLKVVWRKVFNYVRYDWKEIAFPSLYLTHTSYKKADINLERAVLKEASRLYFTSWLRDIGPDLCPNDYKKNEWSDDKSNESDGATKQKEPSTLEDLGGMEKLRPALQWVYMTRASADRDGLKSFIDQEGIKEIMEKKGDSESQQKEDST